MIVTIFSRTEGVNNPYFYYREVAPLEVPEPLPQVIRITDDKGDERICYLDTHSEVSKKHGTPVYYYDKHAKAKKMPVFSFVGSADDGSNIIETTATDSDNTTSGIDAGSDAGDTTE